MRRYETIVIIDPKLSNEQRLPIFEKLKDLIVQQSGFLVIVDEWGDKRLAYEIKKRSHGYYVRLDFCGTGALVNEIERFFRIDDRVLKYMTVLLDKDADVEKIKEQMAEAEAEAEAEASKKQMAEAEASKKQMAEAEASKKQMAEAEASKKQMAEAEASKKQMAEAEASKKQTAQDTTASDDESTAVTKDKLNDSGPEDKQDQSEISESQAVESETTQTETDEEEK